MRMASETPRLKHGCAQHAVSPQGDGKLHRMPASEVSVYRNLNKAVLEKVKLTCSRTILFL